ncbi:MAG: glycosyltransferase family 39 protein [Verrucomicrobiales bacterium]|nr:glycosyltransferase family 39 protein [Verrucomicrobiales bacterium]
MLQPDEGRNAEVAREMKESGAWLSPSYNGIAYLDKPAFYFKAVALSLAAFGNNETAARLPSALFGLALLVMTYGFCRRAYGTRCAIMAVIIIATTPLYLVFSRTIIFDMTLAFFVSAAIFAGYRAEECEGKSRRNWYLLGALAAGFATLVKGPVGFLIPGLVLFIFHRVEGRRGVWKRFFAPLNLLVFFGVTLPWFIGLSLQHPDFPYYGLIEESFHRFTTTTFHRSQPFYFYALIVAGLFLPWSFILPEAGVAAWRNKSSMLSADRLCLVWAVTVVIFFSLSKSKLPGYILTVTVACGILLARFFQHAMANPEGKPARIVGRAAITLTILSLLIAAAALFLSTRMSLLAKPLGLSVADAEELGGHFITAVILLSVFAVLGLLARFRRDAGLGFAIFAIFPLLLFMLNFGAIETIFNIKSARLMAQKIPALPPETRLAFLECFPSGLPFYLNRTATLFTKDGSEITSASNYILFRLKNDPAWPANLVPVTNFDRWISQRDCQVYLITREKNRPRLETIAGVQPTDIQPLTPPYIGVLLTAP